MICLSSQTFLKIQSQNSRANSFQKMPLFLMSAVILDSLSLAFSNIVSSGSVHSFEPSPKTYEYAKANFRSNHCENVHLNQFAITNKDMALNFYDTQEFSAGSFVGSSGELASHNHIEEKITVPGITLDKYVDQNINRIDLIKIDVEGHELDSLSGSKNSIARFKPTVILGFNSYALITHSRTFPQQT